MISSRCIQAIRATYHRTLFRANRTIQIFILVLIYSFFIKNDITWANPTLHHRELLEDIVRDLNDDEIIRLNGILEQPEELDHVEEPRSIYLESIIIFITGTILLFIIARYGTEIKNFLFDTGSAIAHAPVDLFENVVRAARAAGRSQEVREAFVARVQLHFEQNPTRVIHALNEVIINSPQGTHA